MATNFYFQKGDADPIDIEDYFGIRISSIRGLNPATPKDIFKRDWAEENGVDIYVPATRVVQSSEVVMTCFAERTSVWVLPMVKYEQFCEYINDRTGLEDNQGIFYWDTLQYRKVELIHSSNKPSWYQFMQGHEQIMFEVTFLNPSGATEDVSPTH